MNKSYKKNRNYLLNRYFIVVLLFLGIYPKVLYSVEFVLCTHPKTGTNFVEPILEAVTGKKAFWPAYNPSMEGQIKPYKGDFTIDRSNANLFFFSLGHRPFTGKQMDTLWRLTGKSNQFLACHAPYTNTMDEYMHLRGATIFFIARDPRDQIISLLNHYKKHGFQGHNSIEQMPTDEERLLVMIKTMLRSNLINYMGWSHSSSVCVLSFEKLMGAYGGRYSFSEALGEMQKITNALELNVSDKELDHIYRSCFGKSRTFFRGKVGVWQEIFTQEHKLAIKEEIGDLLIKLGYENDLNW